MRIVQKGQRRGNLFLEEFLVFFVAPPTLTFAEQVTRGKIHERGGGDAPPEPETNAEI